MAPDDPPPRLRIGIPATIGRYRIIERVGRGAMGAVYSAHDDAMGRPVAVKVLVSDLESDPDTRARFYREARAAAGLLHPNIITIYDAGEDQGRSYIAMQLLEGWPLAAYMKRPEAAPLERKLDLMTQMCEGLAVAHERGIVHRDLKPGNLFVQSDGLLKILDFGIARVANSSITVTGAMIGTPDYMSPEQARGTQVDTRSDIFSTGAVFYFMLAGHKPFPGPDLASILRQLQTDEPAPLDEDVAPPELARLIARAMAKHPDQRPARIEDLLAGILRFRRHHQSARRRARAAAQSADAARELDERRQQAGELVARGRQALGVRDWPRAVECANAALAIVPGWPDAAALLRDAQQGQAREHRRRSLLLQQVLDRAAEAIADGRFEDAEAAFREAAPIDPASVALQELRMELAEARTAAEEAERWQRQGAEEIRRARAAFRRGRYDEGIARLEEFAAAHDAPAVSAEADRLVALRDRIARSEQIRRGQVIERLRTARERAATGAIPQALEHVRDALGIDPSDLEATALLDELLARELEARVGRLRAEMDAERRADAEPMLRAAREAYERGYPSTALGVALAASRIDPHRPEIADLIEELRRAVASPDEEAFELTQEPLPPANPSSPPSFTATPHASDASAERPAPPGHQWWPRRRPSDR